MLISIAGCASRPNDTLCVSVTQVKLEQSELQCMKPETKRLLIANNMAVENRCKPKGWLR
jgi:hypothetical protein